MAQILMAGAAAVPTKRVKSLHVQFARDGRAPDPIRIDVAVLHEGGTYAQDAMVRWLRDRPGQPPRTTS